MPTQWDYRRDAQRQREIEEQIAAGGYGAQGIQANQWLPVYGGGAFGKGGSGSGYKSATGYGTRDRSGIRKYDRLLGKAQSKGQFEMDEKALKDYLDFVKRMGMNPDPSIVRQLTKAMHSNQKKNLVFGGKKEEKALPDEMRDPKLVRKFDTIKRQSGKLLDRRADLAARGADAAVRGIDKQLDKLGDKLLGARFQQMDIEAQDLRSKITRREALTEKTRVQTDLIPETHELKVKADARAEAARVVKEQDTLETRRRGKELSDMIETEKDEATAIEMGKLGSSYPKSDMTKGAFQRLARLNAGKETEDDIKFKNDLDRFVQKVEEDPSILISKFADKKIRAEAFAQNPELYKQAKSLQEKKDWTDKTREKGQEAFVSEWLDKAKNAARKIDPEGLYKDEANAFENAIGHMYLINEGNVDPDDLKEYLDEWTAEIKKRRETFKGV